MDSLRRAQRLDRELGDPCDPHSSGSLRTLLQVQLQQYHVPRALGGEFQSFEEVGALMRVVARRDMPTAVAYAFSLLGAAVVWLAGNPSQQRALAGSVLRGERVSVAVTESASGSDLLAMNMAAEPSGDGYHLTGDKWLDNDLSHLHFVIIYARTSENGGPRGFSLFLVDRAAMTGGVRATGKTPNQRIRGADLNEWHFDTQVPRSALIGTVGSGFELILKALQISRTICGALSLGALDTSLEIVLRFALQRKVAGQLVAELPESQKLLGEAWAELLIGDSLTGLALRATHAATPQASVHSAAVKYLVPTLTEQAMQKLSVVYGARHYLQNSDDPALFQRMHRDHMIVGVFDGSSQVNLFNLSHQLRSLAIRVQETEAPGWADRANPSVDLDWADFSLSASGQDALLAGFEAGIEALRVWLRKHGSEAASQSLEASLVQLAHGKDELFAAVLQLSAGAFAAGDPQGLELARRYCVIEAVAAVLTEWQLNRDALTTTLADPAVLAVVLHRLAVQLGLDPLPTPCYGGCFAALLARRERDGRCSLYVPPSDGTEPSPTSDV